MDENVFAYSNRTEHERALVLYNNSYSSTQGTVHYSVATMSKASGELRSLTLSEGLAAPADDGLVFAYRDVTQDLEYLVRASHLRDRGLSFSLRGYQYAVVLHWRELRSTAQEPWDRLCDSLAGTGVRSVDTALKQMRLLPTAPGVARCLCS